MFTILSLALSMPVAFAPQEGAPSQEGARAKEAAVSAPSDEEVVAQQKPSYPLKTCVVSGEPLGGEMGEPVDHVVDGRLVRLCCNMCKKELDKAPAEFIARIDAAVIAAQKPTYPLKTCPVSGEELGSMGEPVDHVHGTRLVRFCCKGCVPKFEKSPAEAMAKIDAALIEQQKASYPMKTCPISGEELGSMGEPVDVLYGTRLVRFCCKGCVPKFKKSPDEALVKIEAAKKAR